MLIGMSTATHGHHEPSPPDQLVVLRGATWADYQRMQEMRGDASSPRLAFLDGYLEIISPSEQHEALKSVIGCLIQAWCYHRDIDFTPVGAWTLEDKEQARGAEPDECYKFGRANEGGRPDLAIEVVWTSGRLDKLEIYRKLGVAEVWYWRRGQLTVHRNRDEVFEHVSASEALPGLDVQLLASFVDMRPVSAAVRAFRRALQS
ncbi:MAG: Uma2 family endonuclease [Myxococcota bacterium]|jgi:Uma2 family endonuclease